MISGTVMMTAGFTVAKASAMMAGDGRRVRKNRWQPLQNPKRNSIAIPYMWAIGRMLSILSPAFTFLPRMRMMYSTLPQIAL